MQADNHACFFFKSLFVTHLYFELTLPFRKWIASVTSAKVSNQVLPKLPHARKSRPLILKIDKILAPHYGLNDEELIFLQTYYEKFRCGADEE